MSSRILVLFIVCSAYLPAQTAQVTGVVSDPSGSVIADATVTALNSGNGLRREAKSNASGVYTIPSLQPGNYEINVTSSGFKPVSRSGLQLEVDQVARVDFHLELGSASETVTVNADPALLQTETASLGQEIDR